MKVDKYGDDKEKEIKDKLDDMDNVGQHEKKDYIISDDGEIKVVKREGKKKNGAISINGLSIVVIPKGSRKKPTALGEKRELKKGTGKKPPNTGRRLYTDENPKDTVSVKFSTVQDIKDTLAKKSFKSKSHKTSVADN